MVMDKPSVDRTSVTISKRVHREFKLECVRLGVTQREALEVLIKQWLQEAGYAKYAPPLKEE
jgi:hypothetical protein